MTELKRLMRDEEAATAVEYALIATFVSIGGLFGLDALGTNVAGAFSYVSDTINKGLKDAGLI